jgi:Helicase HerA, central domain
VRALKKARKRIGLRAFFCCVGERTAFHHPVALAVLNTIHLKVSRSRPQAVNSNRRWAKHTKSRMKRIAIIGSTGSGKSTLAQSLARRLRLNHTELDALYWLPGWLERDASEFRSLVDAATTQPSWVIDGGYSEVRDLCGVGLTQSFG